MIVLLLLQNKTAALNPGILIYLLYLCIYIYVYILKGPSNPPRRLAGVEGLGLPFPEAGALQVQPMIRV